MQKCGHRLGRYQGMADEIGALPAAIKLILKKEPSEIYRNVFPNFFPDEVVENAKRKLG